jgi:PadR family transcriptional regulator PadR
LRLRARACRRDQRFPNAPLDNLLNRLLVPSDTLREHSVAARNLDLLQGSLDVIVLKTLSWQPMHGFGIARWIQRVTDERLQVEEGSLYPALYRLENKGLVKSEWRLTENNRRAKYYRLTAAGRRQLTESAETWNAFAGAMSKILSANPQTV